MEVEWWRRTTEADAGHPMITTQKQPRIIRSLRINRSNRTKPFATFPRRLVR